MGLVSVKDTFKQNTVLLLLLSVLQERKEKIVSTIQP